MLKTILSRLPLRLVLIAPFIVQIFTAVGLVGYLSFRAGQKAVEDLVTQLMAEIGNQVDRRMENYLSLPHLINQSNSEALRLNILNLENTAVLERHFWKQLQIYDSITYVYVGSAPGGVVGAGIGQNNNFVIGVTEDFVSGNYYEYSVNNQGDRLDLLTSSTYDSSTRPWFQAAQQAKQPVWSEVYWFFSVDTLGITASQSIYGPQGNFQGVLGVDFHLATISEFLQEIDIGRSGEVFIMERSGNLIASSTQAKLFEADSTSKKNRIRAAQSENSMIRNTAIFLEKNFGNFQVIDKPNKLNFTLQKDRHFLQIFPFQDSYGLDWLIVVVVPESDFMEKINANTKRTIFLCIIALLLATIIGILTARWVTHPLLKINHAAKEIAGGKLDNLVEIKRTDEVGQLANSFNYMAQKLKGSFSKLEHANSEITSLNQAYERFVPSEFLSFLDKESIIDVQLGDQVEKEMTILFSDIRDFTTISEQMKPGENFAFINEYLSYMEPQIQKHGGFIDKYIGDAIMGLFPHSVDDAVQGAISMLQALKQYNQVRQTKSLPPLRIGIGLHTGFLTLGTVGGLNRMDSTVIGDVVNLSSRVEGLTKNYGIPLLITDETWRSLNNSLKEETRFIDRVKAKGKAKAVSLFEVFSADLPNIRQSKIETKVKFEKAIILYNKGNFLEAMGLFQECVENCSEDRPAQVYLERCQSFLI